MQTIKSTHNPDRPCPTTRYAAHALSIPISPYSLDVIPKLSGCEGTYGVGLICMVLPLSHICHIRAL